MLMLYNFYTYGRLLKDKALSYFFDTEENPSPERMYPPENTYLGNLYNLTYEPSEIIPRLYLGNGYNAGNYETLMGLNIGTILNITNEIPIYFPDNFTYHQVIIRDVPEASILNYLEPMADIIDLAMKNTDKNIFVHCFMGSSRSASIVIGYLMKYHRMSSGDAINLVKKQRPLMNLNMHFYRNILEYENKINK